jgi:hypothetical protein
MGPRRDAGGRTEHKGSARGSSDPWVSVPSLGGCERRAALHGEEVDA